MTDDRHLARALSVLWSDHPPHSPRGAIFHPALRARLLADRALSAYFAAVAADKGDAWYVERRTMGERLRHLPRHRRGDALSVPPSPP